MIAPFSRNCRSLVELGRAGIATVELSGRRHSARPASADAGGRVVVVVAVGIAKTRTVVVEVVAEGSVVVLGAVEVGETKVVGVTAGIVLVDGASGAISAAVGRVAGGPSRTAPCVVRENVGGESTGADREALGGYVNGTVTGATDSIGASLTGVRSTVGAGSEARTAG